MTDPAPCAIDLPSEVLEGFRRGDERSFFAVYEAHARDVRAVAVRFFRSAFEREEAVQEIWLNVHRTAAQYDPGRGPFAPWLRVVAANRCLQILRAAGRREPTVELREEDLVAPETPATSAREARVQLALRAFAARLPAEERAVFEGAFHEGESQDDGARRLAISVRRYKYLKKKVLDAAAVAPELAEVLP